MGLLPPGVSLRAKLRLVFSILLLIFLLFSTFGLFRNLALRGLAGSATGDRLVPFSEWDPEKEKFVLRPLKPGEEVPIGFPGFHHPGTPPGQDEANAVLPPVIHEDNSGAQRVQEPVVQAGRLTVEDIAQLPALQHRPIQLRRPKRSVEQPWDPSTRMGAKVLSLLSEKRFPLERASKGLGFVGMHPPPVPRWPAASALLTRSGIYKEPMDVKDVYGLLTEDKGGRSPAVDDWWARPERKLWDPVAKGWSRKSTPRIQWSGFSKPGWESPTDAKEREARKEWVRRGFKHVWEGYKRFAWGHDELAPVSGKTGDPFSGWGATLVDCLDTLLIMNLTHEYNLARTHVRAIDWAHTVNANALTRPRSGQVVSDVNSQPTVPFFETVIRYVGGLVAAYDLSGDKLMLERVDELARWLLPAFGTATGVPRGRYSLGSDPKGWSTGRQCLAEIGSLSLEFTRLAQLTGKEEYFIAIQRITDVLDSDSWKSSDRLGTLLPSYVDPERPTSLSGVYTFGAMVDSYYEYLIKEHLLLGGSTQQYARMYASAMDSAHRHLIKEVEIEPSAHNGSPARTLTVIGDNSLGKWEGKVDHLTCFAGGMMAMGAKVLKRPKDMEAGARFADACVWSYETTDSGVGSEGITLFAPGDRDRFVAVQKGDAMYKQVQGRPVPGIRHTDSRYLGRPETIETVFYMWRTTGDRQWQDRGWQMFTSWMENSITDAGFADLQDVFSKKPSQIDKEESFVLAETFKYYFLLFSDPGVVSLDDFVFNTEAHPFRIPKRPQTERAGAPDPAYPDEPPYMWEGPEPELDLMYEPPEKIRAGKSAGYGTFFQLWARADPNVVDLDELQSVIKPKPDWSKGKWGGQEKGGVFGRT